MESLNTFIDCLTNVTVKTNTIDFNTTAFRYFLSQNSLLLIYLAAINFVTFAVYAVDKVNAAEHKSRIRERTLFCLAAIGGSIGGLLAMYLLRHKTRKYKFTIGIPLILVLQIIGVIYLYSVL